MKFIELKLKDAYLIELDPYLDERGGFTRQFCKKEFEEKGINFEICQCNLSQNKKAGTLRGLHYQKTPYLEAKLISCFRGAFFDVIVDLRKDSDTYLKWHSIELRENDNKVIYVPPNFAHGFQTLEDNTTIYYQLGNYFEPEHYDGLRWDDPKLAIKWPEGGTKIINQRDKSYDLL